MVKPKITERPVIPAKGPIPLADLIAYFQQRMADCDDEITQLVERFNNRPPGSRQTTRDLKRMTDTWSVEKRICRDTVSWLMGVARLEAMKVAKPGAAGHSRVTDDGTS